MSPLSQPANPLTGKKKRAYALHMQPNGATQALDGDKVMGEEKGGWGRGPAEEGSRVSDLRGRKKKYICFSLEDSPIILVIFGRNGIV